MTENVTENVSLRMGKEDVQKMDAFLKDHPEMGGRSLFIRTAINRYINGDAGVEERSENGVFVRLAPALLGAIDEQIRKGLYDSREDYLKYVVRNFMMDPVKEQKETQQAVEAQSSNGLMQ